ncbi:homoserine dehydrogenase [Geosporobacter ferrireducens]|uniref:Homoserine dehydrogenase n=1 Tax=Geosporobacter ferrireducens TaxID=1424294 RepID=A0A1D8GML2_9FIRM|nr:homoserine dehydrogenase [Geosporobacter ferrireducens]AOT72135.1 homoserine dehydrogenase [Geosporobacter ferrireducens]MTI56023.1 homoserine dehydrogenase [Geosporobacter ferrireducens]
MQKIKIGLLGFGTVGSGVWKILQENKKIIGKNCGYEVEVSKILVQDMTKKRDGIEQKDIFTDNPKDILEDPAIEIVIEVMGGIEPAREYILKAIENRKHIVTANKALIATHGDQLIHAAKKAQVELCYEASVAGGIPIIHAIKESLSANRIYNIMGILNGTTNYILSKMTAENMDFETALKEAQGKGYAEADPTSDVEGHDAVYKLTILARLAFGSYVHFEDVYREGITKITPIDIEYAKELGYVIKLLAIAKEEEGKIALRVHPTFVPQQHPLAAVGDAFNAVFVKGNAVGDLMFYGRGAGDLPTGSAVLGDLINIIKKKDLQKRLYENGFDQNSKRVIRMEENQSEYYVRLLVKDVPGVFGKVATEFGRHGVSLSSVIQKGREEPSVSLVFVTHETTEQNVQMAIKDIVNISEVVKLANLIRVEKMS